MIIHGVIQIPNVPGEESSETANIPAWIKSTVGWWAEGLVSDEEFVNGLQYLIKQGIISV